MKTLSPLKQYHTTEAGVMDLIQWSNYIDDGIVLCKDGTLIGGFFFRGPDTASSTDDERNYVTARVNAALSRLGSDYTITVDCVRFASANYPHTQKAAFPDPITRLIDAERQLQFLEEGAHYESYYVLTVAYTPPLVRQSKVVELMYTREDGCEEKLADKLLARFKLALSNIEDSLSTVLKIQRMTSYWWTDRFGKQHLRDELVNYLHFAQTGRNHPINIPPVAMHTSGFIGGKELWVGDTPKIGDNFFLTISIDGFPFQSYPNMLQVLESLPIAYRWSNRMIFLDQHQSLNELKRFRRKWRQKARGFISQVFKTGGGSVNEDAVAMAGQADMAITEASSALVNFGYYTPVIILMGEDKQLLQENARTIIREVEREGFSCRLETLNTVEAWLGSLPGHIHPNVRRSLIHTMNFSDLLPLASTWTGEAKCPCDKYPKDSPALLYGASTGGTPFRLNLHIGDVGHTLIFGPTGAGKSTLLATLIAQFRRYPSASIFAFDKGNSLWALANACQGRHYEIASDNTPNFTPLATLDSNADIAWAEEWIATCFELQTQRPPSPKQREAIHRAMQLHRDNGAPEHRSLTDYISNVQDTEIREALGYYTVSGSFGHLLDSESDGLKDDTFTVLEIEELMAMGEKAAIPVLLYLFRRFEKSLKGQPALLVLGRVTS